MIFLCEQSELKAVAERNKLIKSHVPCCGHDFWQQVKKMEYGDLVLCTRCKVFYAKIKHLPWICEPGKMFRWEKGKLKQFNVGDYHTNHLSGSWLVPVPARVTD